MEPHRARSETLVLNDPDQGTRAPALRTFPKLIDKAGRSLTVDASPEGRNHPRMLGVNFSSTEDGRAQVYVGTTLFAAPGRDATNGSDSLLVIDPASPKAVQNSLVLSFDEPRSYAASEDFSVRYEGSLFGERPAGRFDFDTKSGLSTLTDASALFCAQGVEDQALARIRGGELGVAPAKVDLFAEEHADFVTISSDLLDQGDAYWSHQKCGATGGGGGFVQCRSLFGTRAAPSKYRFLRIVTATSDTLRVESIAAPHGSRKSDTVSDLIACCFPEAVTYEVRASREWVVRGSSSGFRHNVVTTADADRKCALDPSPWKSLLRSRVIEVSCDSSSADCVDGKNPKSIGLANPEDVACVVQNPSTATQTIDDSPYRKCIYTGLSANFVIYRGQAPSERDMEFDWQVRGGFVAMSMSLGGGSDPNTTPESMVFSPELGDLVIADGASRGLVRVNLTTFGMTQYY